MKHLQRSYRFGCILFFVILCGSLFGQTREIDSLKNLINICKVDTTKTRLLNDLGIKYWDLDPNKSISFGVQSINLANKIHYPNQIARSYNVIGIGYMRMQNYLLAANQFLKARKYSERRGYLSDEIKAIHNLLSLYALGLKPDQIEIQYTLDRLIEYTNTHGVSYINLHAFLNVYGRKYSFQENNFDLLSFIKQDKYSSYAELKPLIPLLEAYQYLIDCKYNKAVAFVEKTLLLSNNEYVIISCYEILVDAYKNLRKFSKALKLEQKLLKMIYLSPVVHLKNRDKKSCSFRIKSVYLSDYQSNKYNEQLRSKVRENSRDIKAI